MAETVPAKNLFDDPLIGHKLDGRYTLEALIGEGGTGRVYRARQEATGREVAVKLLRDELLRQEASVRRFQREAQAACRINHPNAITVHDFGTSPEGHCYLVTELIEGETLREHLDRERSLPPEHAFALFFEVLAGVAAAHERGVVHRDLHPGNIFLCRGEAGEERVKVFDFGGARLLDSTQDTDVTGVGTLDLSQLLHSIRYLSPERLQRDRRPDPRSDVYALGLVLFELCTGRYPFQSKDPLQVMAMHLHEPPPLLSIWAPTRDFSPTLQGLVSSMLAKDPLQRPRDAGEVARRLHSALDRDRLVEIREPELFPEPELEMEMDAMPADEEDVETLPIPLVEPEPDAPVQAQGAKAPFEDTLIDDRPFFAAPVHVRTPEPASLPGSSVVARKQGPARALLLALVCLLGCAGFVFAAGTVAYRLYQRGQAPPAAAEPAPEPLSSP